MSDQRLIHDTAWAAAARIMAQVEDVFREEERRDAFALLYEHIRAALETFLMMQAREAQRLRKPSQN